MVRENKEFEPIVPVLTKIPLPKERNEQNDCGPLSVEMLLAADFPQLSGRYELSYLRRFLNKANDEGTLPGNICKFLKQIGYDVEYYTTIDWSKYTRDFGTNFENLPPENRKFVDYFKDGFLNAKKLQDSAQWLTANNIISRNEILNYHNLSEFLRQGKRVIVLVGGNHYLTITGIDENRVYFNNPDFYVTNAEGEQVQFESRRQSLSHEEFEEWVKRNINSTETIVATPPRKEKPKVIEIRSIQRSARQQIASQFKKAA